MYWTGNHGLRSGCSTLSNMEALQWSILATADSCCSRTDSEIKGQSWELNLYLNPSGRKSDSSLKMLPALRETCCLLGTQMGTSTTRVDYKALMDVWLERAKKKKSKENLGTQPPSRLDWENWPESLQCCLLDRPKLRRGGKIWRELSRTVGSSVNLFKHNFCITFSIASNLEKRLMQD